MKIMRLSCFGFLALLGVGAIAQPQATWELLPGSPESFRFDDLEAVSPNVIFITNGSGEVYRTMDGGESWELRYTDPTNRYFRSLGFVSEDHGWVGALSGPDVLLETEDGGATLVAATPRISGPIPLGVCGIYALDDEAVYATGAISGGAYFLYTLDAGESWTSMDLSSHADWFIDVFFHDRQSGLLTGGIEDADTTRVVILGTEDGGQTWTERFRSTGENEWGWKIDFPTPSVGYVSVETYRDSGEGAIIKSTDAGQTWSRLETPSVSMQGVGFRTEQSGWYGGRGTAHVTTDGGQTWTAVPDQLGETANRFAFFGDSLGFAAAERVWRYGEVPIATEPMPTTSSTLWIGDAYPNPFPERVLIPYRLSEPAEVTLEVFDTTGRRLATVERGLRPSGPDELLWDATDHSGNQLPAGTYLYRFTAGKTTASGTMVRLQPVR